VASWPVLTGTRAGHFPHQLDFPSPRLSVATGAPYSFLRPIPLSVGCPNYPASAKSLPDLLRRIRLDLRLQIKQAAEAAGINEWTLINWEKGRCEPSRRLLQRLVAVYSDRGHPDAGSLLQFPPRNGR